MALEVYLVDAFVSADARPGTGNPAAVVRLGAAPFPADHVLQRIAAEHNLSETAFYREAGAGAASTYELRWFTPEVEVDLCGHATLAAAFVELVVRAAPGGGGPAALVFESTRSGALPVRLLADGWLELDFPSRPPAPVTPADAPPALFEALGVAPADALFVGKARDFFVELATPAAVRALRPDFARLAAVDALCVIASARASPGAGADVVSRVFCPACGVPEDPATGSAHCTVVPYFAAALGRDALHCEQASARGGVIRAELRGGGARVGLAGRASLFSRGAIEPAALRE